MRELKIKHNLCIAINNTHANIHAIMTVRGFACQRDDVRCKTSDSTNISYSFLKSRKFLKKKNDSFKKILYLRRLKRSGTRTCPGVSKESILSLKKEAVNYIYKQKLESSLKLRIAVFLHFT